jgi:hypothetical protein
MLCILQNFPLIISIITTTVRMVTTADIKERIARAHTTACTFDRKKPHVHGHGHSHGHARGHPGEASSPSKPTLMRQGTLKRQGTMRGMLSRQASMNSSTGLGGTSSAPPVADNIAVPLKRRQKID